MDVEQLRAAPWKHKFSALELAQLEAGLVGLDSRRWGQASGQGGEWRSARRGQGEGGDSSSESSKQYDIFKRESVRPRGVAASAATCVQDWGGAASVPPRCTEQTRHFVWHASVQRWSARCLEGCNMSAREGGCFLGR